LPGNANITTANGDIAFFRSLGSGNWVCTNYVKRDGTAISAPFLPLAGGTMTGDITMSASMLKFAKGADVASATALPLVTDGNYFDVTGTTTITSFNSVGVGTLVGLHFDGALTLTHNATDLILPGGANITTAAGDEALFIEYASGDYRCISYTKANGTSVIGGIQSGTPIATTSGTSHDFTSIPSTVKRITVMISGVSTNGTSIPIIQIGDSGGVETSGYSGAAFAVQGGSSEAALSSGVLLNSTSSTAANISHGQCVFNLLDPATNTWTFSGNISLSNAVRGIVVSGSKSLSATLDRIRLTTVNGTDTFDAGSINILYE
jgi:hypothetical protein